MNILIIGSGAREHAFAWKIFNSKIDVNLFICNSTPGTVEIAKSISININNFTEIKSLIIKNNIQLLLVGPEIPLINGIYDFIKNDSEISHVNVIGPSKKGAQLEGSKEFAKKFMSRYNIPTASYRSFDKSCINDAINFLKNNIPPYVLKADGPAAGKGVIIVDNISDAIRNLKEMLIDSKFGDSSNKVVIEEFLNGIEMSCFVLFDGKNYKVLPYAKDYKRIGENDTGLNTGGMGSVSPVPFLDKKLKKKIEDKIIKPTIEGIKKENMDYKGFIFIGLINVKNEPYVIEYNVRMGDPETQVVLSRLKNDFVDVLTYCENQTLDKIDFHFDMKTYTNVVLASGGYPEKYEKGKRITGLDNVSESTIFHAGTIKKDNNIYTNGGRVLSIVSSAPKMKEALRKAYNTISKIDFEGKTFRKDIGFDL